jgi:hypothetical protein
MVWADECLYRVTCAATPWAGHCLGPPGGSPAEIMELSFHGRNARRAARQFDAVFLTLAYLKLVSRRGLRLPIGNVAPAGRHRGF